MSKIDDLADRVERLLLRHDELKRTTALLEQQLDSMVRERARMLAMCRTASPSERRLASSAGSSATVR